MTDDKILDDIYKLKSINAKDLEKQITIGKITEKDKFVAAKQILLGLAILYVLTILAYLFRPTEDKLLEICTTTFPPIATLILACYFRDKQN